MIMTTDQSEAGEASDPRIEALLRAAVSRTREAERAAEAGIRLLIKDGGQISFRAVARAGGVSTRFLHRHPDLSTRIRALRAQQRGQAENTHELTASGDNAIIAALRRRLREESERHRVSESGLRTRIKDLERQVAVLHGHLHEGSSPSQVE